MNKHIKFNLLLSFLTLLVSPCFAVGWTTVIDIYNESDQSFPERSVYFHSSNNQCSDAWNYPTLASKIGHYHEEDNTLCSFDWVKVLDNKYHLGNPLLINNKIRTWTITIKNDGVYVNGAKAVKI